MANLLNVSQQASAKLSTGPAGSEKVTDRLQKGAAAAQGAAEFQASLKAMKEEIAQAEKGREETASPIPVQAKGKDRAADKGGEQAMALMAAQLAVPASPAGSAVPVASVVKPEHAAVPQKKDSKTILVQNQLAEKPQPRAVLEQPLVQDVSPKAARQVMEAAKNQNMAHEVQAQSMSAHHAEPNATGLMDGVHADQIALLGGQDLNIEALEAGETKGPKGRSFAGASEPSPKLASSKLSTSDYLNLREISQAANKNAASLNTRPNHLPTAPSQFQQMPMKSLETPTVGLGAQKKLRASDLQAPVGASVVPMRSEHGLNAKVVDAPVTTGSANKPVLSHDAIHAITQQVNQMSLAKQDGEIKIRLRPDHLGELHMSVRTDGQQVSVQIRAKDGESKKIIEDSLSALRDGLSSQKLNLAHIEIVTPSQNAASSDLNGGDFRQNLGSQADSSGNQNRGQDAMERRQDWDQSARQERLFEENARRSNLSMRPRGYTSSRLDMTA